jgi:acetyl/propionyl-CoA carboxylase alpha subunit
MLAKIIVHGADRKQAIARSRSALRELRVEGVKTSAAFAEKLLEMPEFVSGEYHSASVEQKLPELLAQL